MLENFDVERTAADDQPGRYQDEVSPRVVELIKLQEFGRVLYIGAHPDDENNKLITYLTKERHLDVAYLSLTRGEGGQNFIGTESGDDLGVLRVQESVQARNIDGGRQFFTRAKDFGFSKCPQESIAIWGKDAVLEDLVYIIRYYQPDLIISRFSPTINDRHGHHQASAMLINEAFHLSGMENVYPDQLAKFDTWKAKQLLWNVYAESGVKEIGGNICPQPQQVPLLIPATSRYATHSISRLAAESRNQHRCQAMASLVSEGISFEYFEWIAGEPLSEKTIFQDDPTPADAPVRALFKHHSGKAISQLFAGQEKEAVDELLLLLHSMDSYADDRRVADKRAATEQIVLRLLGLEVEAYGAVLTACPGDTLNVELHFTHRSSSPIRLVDVNGLSPDMALPLAIADTQKLEIMYSIPEEAPCTSPVWLLGGSNRGRYLTDNVAAATTAWSGSQLQIELTLAIHDRLFHLSVPLLAGAPKDADSLRGALLALAPPVCGAFVQHTLLIGNDQPATVKLKLKALGKGFNKGKVRLRASAACVILPAYQSFELSEGDEEICSFHLTTEASSWMGELAFEIEIDRKIYKQSFRCIDYSHITPQYYFKESTMKVVKAVIKSTVTRVAYIKAHEEEVATALDGFVEQVDRYDVQRFLTTDISGYEAIVLGVRLYNCGNGCNERVNEKLRHYVAHGGLVISQYHTDYDLEGATVCPYPIKLSDNRITNARSPIHFVGTHPVLNYPNVLTEADFDDWMHDRALFLPQAWDSDFIPVLSSADHEGEQESGLLLVAKKGKGHFVYTSLSLFRQLPLAVPGAYRLFANLLNFRNAALV